MRALCPSVCHRHEVSVGKAGGIGALQNLGPKSQAMLAAVGIVSLEQLRQLGSVRAYRLVKANSFNASLNLFSSQAEQ